MSTPAFANPLLETVHRAAPRRIGVVGAGTIGPDIAYYLKSALPALELRLLDVRQQAIDAALSRLRGYAEKAVARGKMSAAAADATLSGLSGSTDYDSLSGCDWVLEAATEDLALKRRIFADIEARVGKDALITSNTSSLPAARIFRDLKHPERATVTHFFAPAWRNPAVEVIDWPRLDRGLLAWLRRFFAETGKLPLVTSDAVCFMLDRVFDNWCNDAALMLDRASAAQIDTVAGEFVHAGPFFVLNLARGNPIIIETNTLQADEEGEHYRPAPIFASVQEWKTVAPGERAELAPDQAAGVRDRLLGVLWSQTVDILDRGIGSAPDLDLGCRVALGFKAGPLELMEQCGNEETQRVLQRYAKERPGMPMPKRPLPEYQPAVRHVLVDRIGGSPCGDPGAGRGDVLVITLRRPEALNALHDAMTDDILRVIQRHESDESVAGFVITGYGQKAFCAGGDIGRFPTLLGNADGAAQYARDCSRLLVHLDAAQAGGRGDPGHGAGRRLRAGDALPRSRRAAAGLVPAPRGRARHPAGDRRDGDPVPPLAAGRSNLSTHAHPRRAPARGRRARRGHRRRTGRKLRRPDRPRQRARAPARRARPAAASRRRARDPAAVSRTARGRAAARGRRPRALAHRRARDRARRARGRRRADADRSARGRLPRVRRGLVHSSGARGHRGLPRTPRTRFHAQRLKRHAIKAPLFRYRTDGGLPA